MQPAARPHVYSTVETILDPLFAPPTARPSAYGPRRSTVDTLVDPVFPIQVEPIADSSDPQVQAELLLMTSLAMQGWFHFLVSFVLPIAGVVLFAGNPHREEIVDAVLAAIPHAGSNLGLLIAIACVLRAAARSQRRRWLVLLGGLASNALFIFLFKWLRVAALTELGLLVAPTLTLAYAALRSRLSARYCLAQAAGRTMGLGRRAVFTLDLAPFGLLAWFIEPYAQLYRWALPRIVRGSRG